MISGTNSSNVDNKTQNLMIDMMNSILQPNSTVTPDINQISSLLPSIAASQSQSKVLDLLQIVINKIDLTTNDPTNVFSTISTLIDTTIKNSTNNTVTLQQSINLVDQLVQIVANNQVPGESNQIVTKSFKVLVTQLDVNNLKDFYINDNTFTLQSNVYRTMSSETLRRQLSQDGCNLQSKLCISKASLNFAINQVGASTAAVTAKILPSNKIPIEVETQSLNAISITVLVNSKRDLQSTNSLLLKVNYTTRLDLSIDSKSYNDTNVMKQTYCTTYDSGFENVTSDSCSTWYDYKLKTITCECNTAGITLNINDPDAALASIKRQFPIITTPLITKTSLYIMSIGLGIFFFSMVLAMCYDSSDAKSKVFSRDDNFDIVQQCIIEYTKQEFHSEYCFTMLYWYLVKVLLFL